MCVQKNPSALHSKSTRHHSKNPKCVWVDVFNKSLECRRDEDSGQLTRGWCSNIAQARILTLPFQRKTGVVANHVTACQSIHNAAIVDSHLGDASAFTQHVSRANIFEANCCREWKLIISILPPLSRILWYAGRTLCHAEAICWGNEWQVWV